VRDRGQLVKIALPNDSTFVIGQKIRVTACLLPDCRLGLRAMAKQVMDRAKELFNVAASRLGPVLKAEAAERVNAPVGE
jgi:hypothetical protein